MMVLSEVRCAGTWDAGTGTGPTRLTPVQCGENARYPVPVPRKVVLRDGANELNTASWRMTVVEYRAIDPDVEAVLCRLDHSLCPRGSSGDSV